MDQNRPVKQHVVPKAYLRQFADKTGRLQVLRHDDSDVAATLFKPRLMRIKQVATHDDFYTILRDDGSPDVALEELFSKFENKYTGVMKAVRTGKPLDLAIKADAACLAALQEMRGHYVRDALSGLVTTLQERAAGHYRATYPDASDQAVKDAVAEFTKRTFNAANPEHAPKNISLLGIPVSFKVRYDMLRHMYVTVMRSDAQDFITSDSPSVWVNPLEWNRPTGHGFYYMSLAAEFTYPLSRRHCLLFSYMPLLPTVTLNAAQVEIVNARTLYHSYDEAYVTPAATNAERLDQLAALGARDAAGKSLLPLAIDANTRYISLYDAAVYLKADWRYVRERNRSVVSVWKKIGFLNVDLDVIEDVPQAG